MQIPSSHPATTPQRQDVRRRGRFSVVLDRDWFLAFALAFFVGVAVWFGRQVKDFFGPSATAVLVPSFPGQTADDASDECRRLHLVCTVVARQSSDRYPKDVVISQQPVPGSRVREGRAISLIVSNGVQIFSMPDLRYESLRNAKFALSHDHLHLVETKTVENNQIPASFVVAQDPLPLTSVREGSNVRLTLSKGPPRAIRVPNFVNMNLDGAREAATKAKVHLGQIVWTPFGVTGPPRGTVVRQAPGPNAQIDPFAPVSLQVSAGPGEYGYLIRQVHVAATIPARDDTAHVRMQVRDDTGTWNVYDGYAAGGQKIDFNVTVVGSAELETYVNNELLSSAKLGHEPPRPTPSPNQPASPNQPPAAKAK